MNHKRDSLSEAIKRALGLTVSLTTLTGGALAVAQDDEEVLTTEEVLVTGSRIKRADLDNANPVTVVTRDEMMLTGITDVGDLIQRLPSMSGSPIGTTTNNGGNGSVTIDLRGLGAGRTLNLINGRRSVDGGDYQTIPAVMVERIEILKDGAAAYGADAAGVVNIITRKDLKVLRSSYSRQTGWILTADRKPASVQYLASHLTKAISSLVWSTLIKRKRTKATRHGISSKILTTSTPLGVKHKSPRPLTERRVAAVTPSVLQEFRKADWLPFHREHS